MLDSSRSSSAFPASFLFGVATADHQCEAYDPRFEDIRDVWERKRNLTERKKATDFWNRYAGDIQLAKDLGCNSFRFSLAWSRLEPAPGQFNSVAGPPQLSLSTTLADISGWESKHSTNEGKSPAQKAVRESLLNQDTRLSDCSF